MIAQMPTYMAERITISLGSPGAGVQGNPVPLEPVKKPRNRNLGRFWGKAALRLRYQAGTLDLCLSFGAGEAVPAPLALARDRIPHVDNDGPMAG